MDTIDLHATQYYINRELSHLAFIKRVLEQANDENNPLLERLRFTFIISLILDEFFEIRVASLKEQIVFMSEQSSADGLTPQETLAEIRKLTQDIVTKQYHLFSHQLIPALKQQHISFLNETQWNAKQTAWVADYFHHKILPLLMPISLDTAHPFPRLANRSLNFIVSLTGKDAFGRSSGLATVYAPRSLARTIRFPDAISCNGDNFTFLTHIIQAHVNDLFPGMTVTACYAFRITRNSDLWIDEEEADDLAKALKLELQQRRYGRAVRLDISADCPDDIAQFLLEKHSLTEIDLYRIDGPVNLGRFIEILNDIHRPDLRYPPFKPSTPSVLDRNNDLFHHIRQQDILLHHPYQSFLPVLDFIRQATLDKNVLAIKQTLYRTEAKSLIVDALVEAARAGKEVTAVVELRARFDEEENIDLANRLHAAGALVIYGVLGYKTHAKMTLILRREDEALSYYAHLGTGNYHLNTAQQYTDYGLLTCNETIVKDVHRVFQQLAGMGKERKLKKLWQAPFTLASNLLSMIKYETDSAKKGKKANIIIKLNALTEEKLIRALYRASQAGVKIRLLIRGACCLRPGVTGLSENIHVHSIVGRFLEHSRIYYFHHGGKKKLYLSSADWMDRNLYHRVEIAFPIEDPMLVKIIKNDLTDYFNDNTQAWKLDATSQYQRLASKKVEGFNAQAVLLKKLS